nr:translational repressor ifet-1 [Ciona intestinalis]|eukprot:XP_002122102.1 translational repressor ifet-1 [Ciona intestinalis]
MNLGTDDLKKLLCVSADGSKDALENEEDDRVSYSKDTLIILSNNATCTKCPDFLSSNHFSDNGRWDPELWIQSFSPSHSNPESRPQDMKRFDGNGTREDSNVVLGPQRRSFQGGCHVSWKQGSGFSRSTSTKIPDRKVLRQQSQERENPHPQLKRFHSLEHSERDRGTRDQENRGGGRNNRDNESWSFDKSDHFRKPRQPDYKKYQVPVARNFSKKSDFMYTDIEEEPEWISYGPKSQFDTIELAGFEEPDDFSWMGGKIPMDDVPERKKKETKNEKHDSPIEEPLEHNGNATGETGSENENVTTSEIKSVTVNALEESKAEIEKSKQETEASENADKSSKSRFSRWFSTTPDEEKSKLETLDIPQANSESQNQKEPGKVHSAPNLKALAEASTTSVPNLTRPVISTSQPVQTSSGPASGSRSSDIHSTDAFNRLIASLRQSDKEKEQIQQRNQQIQALQSIMKTTQLRTKDNCYNVSSIEEPDSFAQDTSQTSLLKKQLEKQKDAYHQKLRQMEQSQNRSPIMFPGQESQDTKQAMGENFYKTHNDVNHERAAATASLKAKLAGKSTKEENLLQSGLGDRITSQNIDLTPPMQEMASASSFGDKKLSIEENLMKLKRLQSAPAGLQNEKLQKQFPLPSGPNNSVKNTLHQHESALLIAQMLAKAGVTEEQLKQLTIEQQELVIAMVQNHYSQKEIGKMMNLDKRSNPKLLEAQKSSGNNRMPSNTINNLAMNNAGLRDSRSSTTAPNLLAYINDKRTASQDTRSVPSTNYNHVQTLSQQRLLQQGIQQYPIVLPHLMAPPILPQTMAAQHLMHSSPTPIHAHPAMVMHMQQLYASQLAQQHQQQQQAAVLAALQQQQLATHAQPDMSKLQQSIQNLRMGASRPISSTIDPNDRSHFTNPLSQWFSRDVLQQSHFPPVTQLTGQHNLNNYPGSGNANGKH